MCSINHSAMLVCLKAMQKCFDRASGRQPEMHRPSLVGLACNCGGFEVHAVRLDWLCRMSPTILLCSE
jgi:hypothetical protein